MARGDIKWFAQALFDLGKKRHDLELEDIRLGMVNNATVPAIDTPAPHWGGTGTTNFAPNQVALGTAYAGPIALTEGWVLTAAGGDFRLADLSIAQQASGGFSNAHWGIIFNNTDPNKRALGFVDLAGPVGNLSGPINFDWSGALGDALRLAQL